MVTYAKVVINEAYLSNEFGESMARRYFGDELVDAMPRYVRGKRKGLLKGQVRWEKVVSGGWVRKRDSGYVERRVGKVIGVSLQMCEWGMEPKEVAFWEWDSLHMNDRDKARVIVAA